MLDDIHESLTNFEGDVAGEAIANDHVGVAGVQIPTFDIADEVNR